MTVSLNMGTAGNYTWFLDYDITQSTPGNTSSISYVWRIHRNVAAGSGSWWGTPARTFDVTVDGTLDSEAFATIDFRTYADHNFTSGTKVVTHAADGTHAPITVTTAASGTFVSSNFPLPTSFSKTISLPTIPRAATSITRTSGTDTGSASVLAISPLVSSFYYVLKYQSPATGSWTLIGAAGGIVGTSWPYSTTVAHGEIPNATSGTVQFQVTTLDSSGGTQIGSPTMASFTYAVPSGIVPTAGTPTWAEGASTTGLSALTNSAAVFAQGWSKLKPTFTSGGGTGATVVSALATVAGVSGNTTSGTAFANIVTNQGSSCTYDVAVTDSRGRVTHATGTVSPAVHRWSLPIANAGTAIVTPTSGTQTIALSGLSAVTTSFYLSSSQRNKLETRTGYRDVTTAGSWVYGSWTAQTLSGSDGTDNAYAPGSALTIATGLNPVHEYQVSLQVRDIFGYNSVNYSTGNPYIESVLNVPAQNVLMSFKSNTSVGILKVPVNGALDVGGNIYQNGNKVLDTTYSPPAPAAATTSASGIVELATDAETITGTDAVRAVTPSNLQAKVATDTAKGIIEIATDAETIAKTDTTRAVTPSNLAALNLSTKLTPSSVVNGTILGDGSVTFSAVNAVALNGIFTSAFVNYLIVFEGTLSTSTACLFRMRAAGADTAGTAYFYTRFYGATSTATSVYTSSGAQVEIGSASATYHRMELTMINPYAAAQTNFQGQGLTDGSAGMGSLIIGGKVNNSTSYDGINFFPNAGTFTGKIWVYGVR